MNLQVPFANICITGVRERYVYSVVALLIAQDISRSPSFFTRHIHILGFYSLRYPTDEKISEENRAYHEDVIKTLVLDSCPPERKCPYTLCAKSVHILSLDLAGTGDAEDRPRVYISDLFDGRECESEPTHVGRYAKVNAADIL